MRLWSLHPRYLDRQALVACWREGLLAQAVLLGRTKGYRNHPQLERFRYKPAELASYLCGIADEAAKRGYRFNSSLIQGQPGGKLAVTDGQLAFEARHLEVKVRHRNPHDTVRIRSLGERPLAAHPLFAVVDGPVASWERGAIGT